MGCLCVKDGPDDAIAASVKCNPYGSIAMNIRLHYRYRDAGNYKQYGYVVFCNSHNLPLNEIERRIRAALIDGEYFNPLRWRIPSLHVGTWDDELDHDWHEFESLEETAELPGTRVSIDAFLQNIAG